MYMDGNVCVVCVRVKENLKFRRTFSGALSVCFGVNKLNGWLPLFIRGWEFQNLILKTACCPEMSFPLWGLIWTDHWTIVFSRPLIHFGVVYKVGCQMTDDWLLLPAGRSIRESEIEIFWFELKILFQKFRCWCQSGCHGYASSCPVGHIFWKCHFAKYWCQIE